MELFILDEPTSGLDPLMEAAFQQTVREVSAARRHRAAVQPHLLRGGGAVLAGQHHPRRASPSSPARWRELRHLTRTSVTVEAAEPITGLAGLPGVHDLVADTTRARFDVDPARCPACCATWPTFDVRALTSQPPTLEELFMRHYGDGRRPTEASR